MFIRNVTVFILIVAWWCLALLVSGKTDISRVPRQAEDVPEHCMARDSKDSPDEKSRRKRSPEFDQSYSYHRPSTNAINTTAAPENATIDLDKFSQEFLECMKWKIEEGCYEILSNGSAFVKIYRRAFNESDYYQTGDGLYVCSSEIAHPDIEKFGHAFDIVSITGLSISMICIVLHMIMFALIPSLRNLPGYCVISLCNSLLWSYTVMFLRMTQDEGDDCSEIGLALMYFMLTAFFWMNVLSYDVWRAMRLATAKLRVPTNLWMRFGVYSLYSWGGPVIIIVVALVIDETGEVPPEYRLTFSPYTCWFEYRQALLVYFVAPMFTLLFYNLVFFVWSFVMISSASMKTSESSGALVVRFCVFLKLFVVMGLSWIFGSIAAATDLVVFWYLFAVANSFQGVFIFFSFSFGQKTKKAWRKFVNDRKISKVSSCPTQASLQSHQFQEL